MQNIEKIETALWEAADNLRANSKLTSSDYFMPVLGVIFLRHAANRFETASRLIEEDQASGKMPKRKVVPEDYVRRRALYLPETARYDYIMDQAATGGSDLPTLVTDAMTAIEDKFQPLQGILPKDYGIFEPKVLEDLMRLFNSEEIKRATGDVFGKIYEYFLAKFSVQKAHDNGEFFTPFSIVQTIVNIIEPDHGTVFDPACGSGGMFVQSSHFIEHSGGDTARKVVFYGQEKNRDTIRIAKMNLAVHGLEGKIAEAITYYQDEHTLPGKCDFVMANPPFNVDLVDAERIKSDPRLPFGLPGVNKQKKVSNGNYLWISYFWSYLKDNGRAGFVMSSQASSAGHGERDVRRKIVETGTIDVMVAIRSNFFYTRTVPCELWFFDKGRPEALRDKVLMIDARNIFRKVTRKIYDFSPEQLSNLSAIVWLYRGRHGKFLGLIKQYFSSVCDESALIQEKLSVFEKTLKTALSSFDTLAKEINKIEELDEDKHKGFTDADTELNDLLKPYEADRKRLIDEIEKFRENHPPQSFPAKGGSKEGEDNVAQHSARKAFEPAVEHIKGLIKQVDMLYKIVSRMGDSAAELTTNISPLPLGEGRGEGIFDRRASGRLIKQLDEQRKDAVEQLKQTTYFYKQIVWLHERFPDAVLRDVPGLVKLVDKADIGAADWSLTPGRYVGVAPPEVDEDFDFEQSLRDIHVELSDLNNEAAELAVKIQENFEELGI
ncbi:MAG TPA: N-6 DNA methylase [Syntrophales bacterium]|nr:N-6 DNA methylase [Syntrophales bacterium]